MATPNENEMIIGLVIDLMVYNGLQWPTIAMIIGHQWLTIANYCKTSSNQWQWLTVMSHDYSTSSNHP